MAWEYLQTDKFDKRFKPIVEYLKDKTKDKVILDLDCGTAPIARYLERDWKEYIGNDIEKEFKKQAEKNGISDFWNMDDEEFARKIKLCDILLCLGMGGGDIQESEPESKTLRQSLIKIAEKCKPKIIILEGITLWEKDHQYYTKIKEQLKDYNRVEHHIINIDPKDSDSIFEREINILERVPKVILKQG